MPQVTRVFRDPATLYRIGAERVARLAGDAIHARGACHLALAGGATPEGLYRELAAARFADTLDWQRLHIWFGDERCVPPEHPDSNYRMARQALLDHVPIPPGQIHRMACERGAEAAALEYAKQLQELPHADGQPQFDLVLLGLGPDGHVASLFPDTDILERSDTPTAAVYVDKLESWRVSLTLPVLNRARQVLLLVAGDKKTDVVRHVLRSAPGAEPLPVQRLNPPALEWLLDAAAARWLGLEPEA